MRRVTQTIGTCEEFLTATCYSFTGKEVGVGTYLFS